MTWTKQQMLDEVKARFSGWSLDPPITMLLTALSALDELPHDIKEQEQKLTQAIVKADAYARLREALFGLTSHQIHFQTDQHVTSLAITEQAIRRSETSYNANLELVLKEYARITREIEELKIDWARILRFLRAKLK